MANFDVFIPIDIKITDTGDYAWVIKDGGKTLQLYNKTDFFHVYSTSVSTFGSTVLIICKRALLIEAKWKREKKYNDRFYH